MSSSSILKTNHPQKDPGQGHVTHFNFFWTHNDISGMAKARVITFCISVDCIIS